MDRVTSPRNDDEGIEQAIVSKGLNAPLVKRADVANEIASEHYFTAAQGAVAAALEDLRANEGRGHPEVFGLPVPKPLSLLTFCVIVLKNGVTVTGESACASPENFDADIGRRVARANAVQKIWPLLCFRLKDALNKQG